MKTGVIIEYNAVPYYYAIALLLEVHRIGPGFTEMRMRNVNESKENSKIVDLRLIAMSRVNPKDRTLASHRDFLHTFFAAVEAATTSSSRYFNCKIYY